MGFRWRFHALHSLKINVHFMIIEKRYSLNLNVGIGPRWCCVQLNRTVTEIDFIEVTVAIYEFREVNFVVYNMSLMLFNF